MTLFYLNLVGSYLKGWLKTPETILDKFQDNNVKISILVAARNEEESISKCIESLLNQNYPKELYEIILLDDFSDDNTVVLTEKYESVKIIRLKDVLSEEYQFKSNKKRAITFGVEKAMYPIVITTDADCFYPTNWLKSMAQCYLKTSSKMIIAPVAFYPNNSFISNFLELDLISLVGITCGSAKNQKPIMANGANLLFEKQVFLDIGGFKGNDHIASGDDVFLMQKINQNYTNAITFLKNKEAIIFTKAPDKLTDFIHQRIRWTSKSVNAVDKRTTITLGLNYFFYLSLFLNIFILPFYHLIFLKVGVLMFFSKLIIDSIFFSNLLMFFNRKKIFKYFLLIEFAHLIYISLLGILSLYGKYTWKNRKN